MNTDTVMFQFEFIKNIDKVLVSKLVSGLNA